MPNPDSIWPGAMRAMADPHVDRRPPPWSSTVSKLHQAIDDASLWLWLALMGASGASVLALGMLLRSNQALSPRVVLGTVLHSSAWAAGVFLLTYSRFPDDAPFLVGLSVMSGMGAASFVDLLLLLLRQRMGGGAALPTTNPTAPPAPPPERQP